MKNKFYFISSKISEKELLILFKEEKFYKCRVFYIDDSGKIEYSRCNSFEDLKENFLDEGIYNLIIEFLYNIPQEITMRKIISKDPEVLYEELTSIFDKRKINKCFNYLVSETEKEEVIERIIKRYQSDLIGENKEIISLFKEDLRTIIEIDNRLYNDEPIESTISLKIKLLKLHKIKNNKVIDNFLEKMKKKYENIENYDYSKLSFIFDKRDYCGMDFLGKIVPEELEEILLDESIKKLYKYIQESSKKWLKESFGKGLQNNNIDNFIKYVENYNLEKLLLKFKQRKEKNYSIEISKSNMRKIEEIIQEDLDLLKNIIFFDETPIRRYDLEKIEKIFDLLKKTNNSNKENVVENLIRLFYLKVLEDFFKECEVQLNENEGYYVHLSKDYKDEKEIQERINEQITSIGNIYNGDKILKKYFRSSKIIPDKIYKIFKKYETEIVRSINERNLKTLKELQNEVTSEILEFLKNNKIITIDFSKILESTYSIESILREFIQRYEDFQLIRIRYHTMKKIIKDNLK